MKMESRDKDKRWLKRDLFKLLRDIVMLVLRSLLRFFFNG